MISCSLTVMRPVVKVFSLNVPKLKVWVQSSSGTESGKPLLVVSASLKIRQPAMDPPIISTHDFSVNKYKTGIILPTNPFFYNARHQN